MQRPECAWSQSFAGATHVLLFPCIVSHDVINIQNIVEFVAEIGLNRERARPDSGERAENKKRANAMRSRHF